MWRGRFTAKVRSSLLDLARSRDLRQGETDVKRAGKYTDAFITREEQVSRVCASVCLCWVMCACVSVYASEPVSVPEGVHVCVHACVCVASLESTCLLCAQLEDEGVWACAYGEERKCLFPAAEMQMFRKSQRSFHTALETGPWPQRQTEPTSCFHAFSERLAYLLPTRQVLSSGQKLGSQAILANMLP